MLKKFTLFSLLSLFLSIICTGAFSQSDSPTELLPNGLPAYEDEIAEFLNQQGDSGNDHTQLGSQKLAGSVSFQGDSPSPYKVMACPSSGSLTTMYASNNGQAGQMFDIVALTDVVIECFDVNMYNGGPYDWELRYKTGTHVGFETNAAAWTLLGTASGVPSSGSDNVSALPINAGVSITAGNRAAFYLTVNRTTTPGGGNRYTNGTTVGALLASDANIQILEGTGKAWLFGSNYTPRQFNGTVYYNPVVLSSGIRLEGTSENGFSRLSWTHSATHNPIGFSIECADNGTFKEVAWLDIGTARQQSFTFSHKPREGEEFASYRIKQMDENGSALVSNIITVNHNTEDLLVKQVYPVPADEKLFANVMLSSDGKIKASVVDMLGKKSNTWEFALNAGDHLLELPTEGISPGVYTLVIEDGKSVKAQKVVLQ